jgi:hypothetical protein
MENANLKQQAVNTKEHLESYVHNEIFKYKLLFYEKTAKLGGFLFAGFFVSLLLLIFIVMLSISFALFLGEILDNYALSFLLTGLTCLLLSIVIFLLRKPLFSNPVLSALIKEIG